MLFCGTNRTKDFEEKLNQKQIFWFNQQFNKRPSISQQKKAKNKINQGC